MKNLLFCFTVIVLLFFISTSKSNSQCANCISPATQESTTMTIPGTSCIATINYCLLCSPTGNTIVTLCNISIPNNFFCNGVTLQPNFFISVRKLIAELGAKKCAEENNIPIGPCPNRVIIETYFPTCAKWVSNTENGSVTMVPCFQFAGQCYQQWEICFQDPNYIVTKVGEPIKDPGICEDEIIILPPTNFNECFEICY